MVMLVKRIILLINVFLLCFSINAQDIIISQDFTETEIRTKRVELGLEVNHGVNLSGDLYISFGTNTSSLTTQLVATVSSTQNYDSKTDYLQKFTFSQDNLTANTSYYYRWQLSTNENGTFYSPSETGTSSFTTLTGFNVLPLQVFEIPEDGLKVGDTIGKLKYDDTDGSWQKIQTFYKTSVGLKTDGTLWAWGRNAKRLITEYCNQSQVIYEPVKITIPPNYSDIDSDNDGYWNIDETTYGSRMLLTKIQNLLTQMEIISLMLLKHILAQIQMIHTWMKQCTTLFVRFISQWQLGQIYIFMILHYQKMPF